MSIEVWHQLRNGYGRSRLSRAYLDRNRGLCFNLIVNAIAGAGTMKYQGTHGRGTWEYYVRRRKDESRTS